MRAIALILALLCLCGPAAALAQAEVRLATQGVEEPLQVEPPVVGYTGDGTGYLGGRTTSPRHLGRGGLHWLSWGGSSALAHGYAWLNDCRPYCARGTFHRHQAVIRVRRPRHELYTRMTIKFRYQGSWAYDHRILEYADGYYVWGICGSRYTRPC
ncbi:MAG TPA: hypothetical protein VFP17_00880 [Solirubrobacterales bacterium]|nr:hypothetical protein [Solirubrobacterales bacterium]